jgi:hypothetical protein
MSAEEYELPDEEAQRSWKDRVAAVADAWSALIQTRVAIFHEELAVKAILLAKGAAAVVIAVGLASGALLLLAALLAALLTQWFGNLALGILGALILYGAGAAFAVTAAIKWLRRVKPLEFPAAESELRRDWSALRAAWEPEAGAGEDERPGPGPQGAVSPSEDRAESLEERYRAGAE